MPASEAFRASPPTDLAFLIAELDEMKHRLAILEAPSGEQIDQTMSRIPITDMNVIRTTGFAASAAWVTYASTSLFVPAGKSTAKLLAIGSGAILDTLTGGITSSDCRVVIQGGASGSFPASKDSGAMVVNNVLKAEAVATLSGLAPGDELVFEFQIKALNGTAFPAQAQNFAQITALGVFSL